VRIAVALATVAGCSFSPGSTAQRDAALVTDDATDPTDASDATVTDAVPDSLTADAQTDFIIEAESYTSTVDGTAVGQECTWGVESTVGGFSGASYMRVIPASGRTCVLANNECAQLIFNIPITVQGTYYVHARAYATGGGDNSLWYGVDGTPEATDWTLPMTSTWTWMTGTSYILAPGTHTVHLWQRESGARVDVIALTTSSTPPPP